MRSVFFAFVFLAFSQAMGAVWPHQPDRVWNEAWEAKYSAWFQNSVDANWLQKPGFIFDRWPVDCAKFVYLARLYFSYENGLEFAIRDSRQELQKISSLQKNWDSISQPEQRVQAFAQHILSRVNTSTLPRDTFLLPLNKESIRPGVILAGDRQRAHTWMINQVRSSGVPTLLYATMPQSEYLYVSYGFPAPISAFAGGQLPTDDQGGLRQFRWPQDLLKPAHELSRRSLDQTKSGRLKFENFFDEVEAVLRVTPKNENEEFSYMMDDLCAKVRARVNVIIDAGQALRRTSSGRFTREQEDLYSTPQRDRDILTLIRQIDAKYLLMVTTISKGNMKRYSSLIRPNWTSDDECLISWADNRLEPLGAIRTRFIDGRISSSPYDSFAQRWGEIHYSK